MSLHITSHIFDEPTCVNAVKAHDTVVTIHGCNDAEEIVFLGGFRQKINRYYRGKHQVDGDGSKNSRSSISWQTP